MSGNSLLPDTNIVLYLLSGDKTLAEILYRKKLYLSFINQLELLGFEGITSAQEKVISRFIDDCIVIDINDEIKKHVIELRKVTRLKLPDCIVAATALFLQIPLITSDGDFRLLKSPEVIIYQ